MGVLEAEDTQASAMAVYTGTRILSSYKVCDGKIWLITEADRSSTCFLLPAEYSARSFIPRELVRH